MEQLSLREIRDNERESHRKVYTSAELYKEGSWLYRPVKTILELFPGFSMYSHLRVLDLGCGVGRNAIAIAKQFQDIDCIVDCVDLLDVAIDLLKDNAEKYKVLPQIHPILRSIDAYPIPADCYDWILAVSALEHMDNRESFFRKLTEICEGIRSNGIVSLILNSEIEEVSKETGAQIPAQFEVNLPTDVLLSDLYRIFSGWTIMKSSVQKQHYEIPRKNVVSDLRSNVVTFVAKKEV